MQNRLDENEASSTSRLGVEAQNPPKILTSVLADANLTSVVGPPR